MRCPDGKKKKMEMEQSRMDSIKCITDIAALMVAQKKQRRGDYCRLEASKKDLKGWRVTGI